MPCHAMVLLGLAHLCRPQAESTRIETNIPGNDFVAPYGFEERSNFVKARKGKRYEDILCNATHSVWEEENRQSMNLFSKKVCAEQQLYHGGWEQESINGSWMGPLDPELSFSPERRSAFTFFSHSFVDYWWWITLLHLCPAGGDDPSWVHVTMCVQWPPPLHTSRPNPA